MSILFKSPAQQLVYERARQALAVAAGMSVARHESEPSLRVTREGGHLHIHILPQGELDAMVRVGALVASDAKLDATPLLRYLLEQNSKHPIGAFSIDPDGHVLLEHAYVASAYDSASLPATLDALFKILAQHQPLIQGFIQRTAELAAAEAVVAAKGAPSSAQAPAAPPPPPPKPAFAPPQPKPAPTHQPTRIQLDDMGIYHCIRGLPVAVLDLLDLIEAGQTDAQIISQFTEINSADLDEVRLFGPSIREAAQAAAAPPAPEPEPEPPPTPKKRQAPAGMPKHPRRLKLDALGMFYCVRDLPISVDELLDLIDAGKDDPALLRDYPDLTREDLEEVKHFGPSLRQPKPEPKPEPEPEPPPVVQPKRAVAQPPTEAPVERLAAPTKRRTLKRIRLDELGIYFCIRGLPISVDEVIERLDAGKSQEQILAEYKALEPEDIEEVLWYRDKMRGQT